MKYVFDLMKSSQRLAIIPNFDKNKGEIKKSQYYSIVVIMFFVTGGAFSLYGIIVYFYPRFRNTTTVLRLLCVIELSIMNIVTVLVATFNTNVWSKFLKLLMHLDEKLNEEVLDLIDGYDIVGVSETWLSDLVDNLAVAIPGYTFFRMDRSTRGGGIGIYVKNNISSRMFDLNSINEHCEQLWIQIKINNILFAIGNLYRPPKGNLASFINSIDDSLSQITAMVDEIICFGDMNVNLLSNNILSGYFGSKKNSWLELETTLYHAFIFIIFGYDAYMWCINYNWFIFRFSIFKYVNFYHCIITLLVVSHFASALAERSKTINKLLVKSSLHSTAHNFIVSQRSSNIKSVKDVTYYYLLLSELIEKFNTLFGWQIFLATENIFMLLLDISNSLMLATDRTQKFSETNNNFKTIFCLTSISILIIMFHSRIILHCEDVNNESKKTLTKCYNLQQTVSPDSEDRKELIILGEIVTLLKTRTNAAGFYYIDRGIISKIFDYLFSFSIFMMQFNKQSISKEQSP
ncbi:uncharacterized protein [Leptinotarsa decemlineata]|uniref:uncharacterized protein n=1 Tax=Leptinotarsa decemlineata TaxID=7539 RepID=UPI003D3054C7